jgi:hypothetical protein
MVPYRTKSWLIGINLAGSQWKSNKILPFYSRLVSVLGIGCILWQNISFLWQFFTKEISILNWAYLLRNCQILSLFRVVLHQIHFESGAARIRNDCFLSGSCQKFQIRPDPDPQQCWLLRWQTKLNPVLLSAIVTVLISGSAVIRTDFALLDPGAHKVHTYRIFLHEKI